MGGSHLKMMSSPRISTMPSQNDGVAMPAREKMRTA